MDVVKSWYSVFFTLSKEVKQFTTNEAMTPDPMDELERCMLTAEFLAIEQSEQAMWLLEQGNRHRRKHYEMQGGDQIELQLAMRYFEEASKLGNKEAAKQLVIQKTVEQALDYYDKGLRYWNGTDGYSEDKEAAKECMKEAGKLGLFVAAKWGKANGVHIPIIVEI